MKRIRWIVIFLVLAAAVSGLWGWFIHQPKDFDLEGMTRTRVEALATSGLRQIEVQDPHVKQTVTWEGVPLTDFFQKVRGANLLVLTSSDGYVLHVFLEDIKRVFKDKGGPVLGTRLMINQEKMDLPWSQTDEKGKKFGFAQCGMGPYRLAWPNISVPEVNYDAAIQPWGWASCIVGLRVTTVAKEYGKLWLKDQKISQSARAGRHIFTRACIGCHGIYNPDQDRYVGGHLKQMGQGYQNRRNFLDYRYYDVSSPMVAKKEFDKTLKSGERIRKGISLLEFYMNMHLYERREDFPHLFETRWGQFFGKQFRDYKQLRPEMQKDFRDLLMFFQEVSRSAKL